jgi:hypothetical protein
LPIISLATRTVILFAVANFLRVLAMLASLMCIAIEHTALADKIYFTDDGRVYKANLDGTGRQRVGEISSAYSLALDIQGGQMYWAGVEGISRANLDGSNIETVVPPGPTGIALDLHMGRFTGTVMKTSGEQTSTAATSNCSPRR